MRACISVQPRGGLSPLALTPLPIYCLHQSKLHPCSSRSVIMGSFSKSEKKPAELTKPPPSSEASSKAPSAAPSRAPSAHPSQAASIAQRRVTPVPRATPSLAPSDSTSNTSRHSKSPSNRQLSLAMAAPRPRAVAARADIVEGGSST